MDTNNDRKLQQILAQLYGIYQIQHEIAAMVREVHDSIDIKDTYQPGDYKAIHGDMLTKDHSDSDWPWTVCKEGKSYGTLDFDEVMNIEGPGNFPLQAVDKGNA